VFSDVCVCSLIYRCSAADMLALKTAAHQVPRERARARARARESERELERARERERDGIGRLAVGRLYVLNPKP
jgi:hypothetical protein